MDQELIPSGRLTPRQTRAFFEAAVRARVLLPKIRVVCGCCGRDLTHWWGRLKHWLSRCPQRRS